MARDNSSLYVLSIVAVVAVVGLVTLFMGDGGGVLGDDGNLAGQAFYSKGIPMKGDFAEPVFEPKYSLDEKPKMELDLSSCTDTDAWSGVNHTFVAGNVTIRGASGVVMGIFQDKCLSKESLLEYVCDGKYYGKKEVFCGAGCELNRVTRGYQCARP